MVPVPREKVKTLAKGVEFSICSSSESIRKHVSRCRAPLVRWKIFQKNATLPFYSIYIDLFQLPFYKKITSLLSSVSPGHDRSPHEEAGRERGTASSRLSGLAWKRLRGRPIS
ncbi:hypothetical protein [Desulfolutivibrio sulfoxidireducens]|uniref:hypothetical protein n=1 Tax=Desulfolutivibrio sulfoxidireducens TaxID=2773299 RepID=UPI00159E4E02|nr:hypothetical protein [Desulfolutivibrio sulfoxidireducens]QLA17071.1 hypothetical protein GD605_13700 [Desulfolutivibrio sulfoxidireducens]QLA20639.1 hypothetical protein GD604_13415 [Desulfolutivibrio sulfoxidireducens]